MKKFIPTLLLVGIVLGGSLLEPKTVTTFFSNLLKNHTNEQPQGGNLIVQENPENVEPHRGSGRCDDHCA